MADSVPGGNVVRTSQNGNASVALSIGGQSFTLPNGLFGGDPKGSGRAPTRPISSAGKMMVTPAGERPGSSRRFERVSSSRSRRADGSAQTLERRRARRLQTQARARQAEVEARVEEQKREKLGGFIFWFVAGLAMVKDFVIDPLTDLMIAGGLGISVTVVGMLVGLPFAGFAWLIKVLYFASFFVVQLYYFWTHGGIHESIKLQRLVIWGIGIFTEWIPILDDLPMTTFMFLAVAYLENKKRTGEVAGRVINVAMRYAK